MQNSKSKCLFSMYSPFTSLLGFLLWSLSQSMTSQRALFTSYLSFWSFLTQLIPTPFLFSAFLSNSTSYFDSNDYPHRLRDIVLSDRAQIFNKRWVAVSDTLSKLVGGKGLDYRLWSRACETKPQPLSTVPLPVHICDSAELVLGSTHSKAFVDCLRHVQSNKYLLHSIINKLYWLIDCSGFLMNWNKPIRSFWLGQLSRFTPT